jgi:hypothetical protein
MVDVDLNYRPRPITRIWEGKLEWTETPYFQGQLMILRGGRRGMWIDLTGRFESSEKANEQLQDTLQSFLGF